MKNEINISLPRSWAELTPKQLILVSKILSLPDLTDIHIQLLAFKALSGLNIIRQTGRGEYLCKLGKKRFVIPSWQMNYHLKKMEWITGMPFGLKPLPMLASEKPVSATLEGTPFKLYLAAENYYQAYMYTKSSDYLMRLTCVLYSGRRLAIWNDNDTEGGLFRFSLCPPEEIFTVFLWYTSIKALLADRFSYLFSLASADVPEAPDMRSHVNNMLRALTGGDVTKLEAVLNSETWYALNELNEKCREMEELNKKR